MVQPSRRHARVGVDEEQPRRRRDLRGSVHLHCPATGAAHDPHIGPRAGDAVEPGIASPVGHEDVEPWIRPQTGQETLEGVQIINDWNDQ